MRISDWSSDVCSSDLFDLPGRNGRGSHDKGRKDQQWHTETIYPQEIVNFQPAQASKLQMNPGQLFHQLITIDTHSRLAAVKSGVNNKGDAGLQQGRS